MSSRYGVFLSPTSATHATPRVLRGFDNPDKPWLPGHRGVDLELAVGAPVFAAGEGTVAFAGVVAGKPVVSIDHGEGLRTTYEPVYALVSRGDVVQAGVVIGRLAPSVDGYPGLGWGARTGRKSYINPLSLLQRPVIRLKPTPAR
nr:M23 family metallopeptidase [Corynebacterium sp. 13CS0277]